MMVVDTHLSKSIRLKMYLLSLYFLNLATITLIAFIFATIILASPPRQCYKQCIISKLAAILIVT